MKKKSTSNILKNINLIIGLFVILANIVAYLLCDASKSNFIMISSFLNVLLFFFYCFIFEKERKANLNEMKKEALYINYPLNIGTFLFCLFLILVASAICLYVVNKAAFNMAFVFTFFMSILSMLAPSMLLLVYVIFVVPAFILPGIDIKRDDNTVKDTFIFLIILLVGFIFLSAFKYVTYSVRTIYIDKESKFKIEKLPVQYSTQYLELVDISPYGKKKLATEVTVPFAYTQDSFNNKTIDSAENFCRSMGARVPNYLEIYNVVFNKFNTFGDKYYWTVDKDGKTPLVLHFKNMSYTIEKYDGKAKPVLYCVANEKDNPKIFNKNYLYRTLNDKNNSKTDEGSKAYDPKGLLNQNYERKDNSDLFPIDLNNEKKHVNFSVKEVSEEIMDDLIRKGYMYNKQLKINTRYETNDQAFSSKLSRDANKRQMRLCYYPFTDYGTLSISSEAQIWKQSFCSPSFILIDPLPVLKNKQEKDAYCSAKGGRLPNIPELNGIFKTLNINNVGTKYWTNNKVNQLPMLVFYKDARFMRVKVVTSKEIESAYVYCVTESRTPSKIIANYKSRFSGIDGSVYAKAQCPNCQYYEVPDTVILSY